MWRIDGEDDGAVVLMVVILMVALIGFGAIVVDVGALFSERRQLQNGADAAALAIIEDCARAGVPCNGLGGTANAIADQYADANANDGRADGTADLNPSECRVQVLTSTRDTQGGTLIRPFLAQVLDSTYEGSTVQARAVAVCGGPEGGSGLPLIISEAAFKASNKYTVDWDWPPPDGWAPPSDWDEAPVFFHSGSKKKNDYHIDYGPGAFAWLTRDEDASCQATVRTDQTLNSSTGKSYGCNFDETGAPAESQAFWQYIQDGNPHLVPIYEGQTKSGTNLDYDVFGFAAIWITGYNFPGQFFAPDKDNRPCGHPPDGGEETCISGYFLNMVVSPDWNAHGVVPGESLGVVNFALIE